VNSLKVFSLTAKTTTKRQTCNLQLRQMLNVANKNVQWLNNKQAAIRQRLINLMSCRLTSMCVCVCLCVCVLVASSSARCLPVNDSRGNPKQFSLHLVSIKAETVYWRYCDIRKYFVIETGCNLAVTWRLVNYWLLWWPATKCINL